MNNKKYANLLNKIKMKGHMAKAVALAMCFVLFTTSVDITAFAFTGGVDSDKNIVRISSLSDEIAHQKVGTDATLEDIEFPESLDVHVTYQAEKEIDVEVEKEEQATPTPTSTPTPSAETTPTVEPTPSAEVVPTETLQGEDDNTPEETNEENQGSDTPEQDVPANEPVEESNQPDDTQNENTESQPDGEQVAKITYGEYGSVETVYVPMTYYAAEPSKEEVVVETLEKSDVADKSDDKKTESKTEIKKETVIEKIEEDDTVSVTWTIDEENSSKAEFKDLIAGEKYIFVPTITEDGYKLADDVDLPVITVNVEDNISAFEQSVTVDDVVITVTADDGVFPEGATIEARKVTDSEESEVTEAIDEVRSEEKNVAVSYTFDITICDKDGNEIEPDTSKGSVKVIFKMAEIANENLETDVYHVEETDEGLNAEGLDVNTEEGATDEAAVETEGFSFYTVEFTYGELQYVLEGDEKVELTTILDTVGIKENGEIDKVEGSDDELFKPVFEDDTWYIESLKAFSSEEWLKVTINGIEYEIVVTDAVTGEWSKLLAVLDGTSEKSEEGQFDVSSDAGVITIKLLTDFTASSATTLTVKGDKKLDLNGHVINADGCNISVITIVSGATLILEDSDESATHEGLPAGGIITGGSGVTHGGGVVILGGTFIMNAGTICNNSAINSGGGICVGSSGNSSYNTHSVFVMNGGTITGNVGTSWGGGVCVGSGPNSSSTFTMNGGLISNNSSVDGGGVHVGGNGSSNTFNMCGGTISGNNATGSGEAGGGGVSVYLYNTLTQYNFVMTGGTITENTANGNGGGANIRTGSGTGKLTVGGTAKILNNKKSNAEENIYIGKGKSITVGTGKDAPKNGMFVGVTLYGENGDGSGYVTDTTGTGQYAQYFNSDNSNYKVLYKDGRVYIGTTTGSGDVLNVNTGKQYGTIASAIDEASSGDTIQLLGNISENVTVTKDITLDLNGYELKGTGSGSVVFVNESAKLTLEDGSQEKTGKITGGNTLRGGGVHVSSGIFIMNGGSITGNASTNDGGGVYVDNGCKFIMEGGTISTNTANANGGGVFVNKADFDMSGGTISSNTGIYGGGVCGLCDINPKTEFILSGGEISGNTATYGGGVHLNGVTFTMNSGIISGNTATYSGDAGGGVHLAGVTFTMNNGTISNNKAFNGNGGGIVIPVGSQFTMNDGTIGSNSAYSWAGGVCNWGAFIMNGGAISNNEAVNASGGGVSNAGSVIMTGGSITGNKAKGNGGGFYNGSTQLTFGKAAKIIGNFVNTVSNNVYLENGKNITISEGSQKPVSGMNIGVKMQTPGVFTSNTADGYLSYFSSDDSTYKVVYDTNKKLKLARQYNVTIDASITNGTVTTDATDDKAPAGDTVTVTVTPNSDYKLSSLKYNDGTEHDITSAKYFTMPEADVTIIAEFVSGTNPASTVTTAPTAKSLTYNGADQALVTEGVASGGTMNYVIGANATTAPTTGWSISVPTGKNAGTYYVWYKSAGDREHSDSEPVCVTVTLAKANHTVTAPTARNPVYNGNEQVLISAGSCTTGTIKYSLDGTDYYDSIDSIKKKEIGSYTVYYKVEGNGNYETYGPKTIKANIVKEPDPTPTPTPKPDPKPTPSPSEPDPQPNPQPTIPVTSTIQYAETGNPIKNYVANNPTGSNIPLPYITTDGSKAGWKTIDEALDAHKAKYKKNAVGTLSITMNGSTTVDTKLITDAHEKKIPLSFALDDEVAIGIPVANTVLSDQAKEGKTTYFKVSSMTTAEAVSVKKAHAGLLPSDIVAIGGDANTPVVLTLCSNDKLSTKKSQLMTITFNAKKAGFKKGDRVYLYCGTSQIGISMYKAGKVDKNGFVTFSVPMVSNYWTIGSTNMGDKLFRNN